MAMTSEQLRARVHELMASQTLPSEPPAVHRVGHGHSSTPPACLICDEPHAAVAYVWNSGQVAHLHAACDALWKRERGTKREG